MEEEQLLTKPRLKAPMSRREIAEKLKIGRDAVRKMLRRLGIQHSELLTQRELTIFEEHYFKN